MEPLALKRPGEERVIEYDFGPDVPTGVTITSYSAIAYDGVTDVSANIILTTSLSGTKVKAKVRNGEIGKRYKLRFKATRSDGDKIESYPDVTLEII